MPRDLPPEEIVVLEPRSECRYAEEMWPKPTIVDVVAWKIRLIIDTSDPKQLRKNEHFCQAILTTTVAETAPPKTPEVTEITTPPKRGHNQLPPNQLHSNSVMVDPDLILKASVRQHYHKVLQEYDDMFNPSIDGNNNALGKFEMTINMGSTQPPQGKGCLPQYSREKLLTFQQNSMSWKHWVFLEDRYRSDC